MHDIKNDIKNGTLCNIYILTGEERYLIDYYTDEIKNAVSNPDTRDFNLMEIYNSLPDEEALDSFVSSYPFMSEKKLLIFKDTRIFKSINANLKDYFSELVSAMPEYLVMIFAEGEVDKRSSLYKQISKIYPVCEYEFQQIPALTSWITKLFAKYGKNIGREDAAYICEIAGPSMLSLKSEAEKLISYFGEEDTITRDAIDRLVTRNIENRVFAMIDDIAAGKNEDAMTKFQDLKSLGEEPVKIINIIFKKYSTFHSLLLVSDRPMKEICSLTGLYEKHARNNLAQAKKLGGRKIANVMMKCRDMDFAVKNGTAEKWLAAELVISEALN